MVQLFEYVHNRWPKHADGYNEHNITGQHISICTCWLFPTIRVLCCVVLCCVVLCCVVLCCVVLCCVVLDCSASKYNTTQGTRIKLTQKVFNTKPVYQAGSIMTARHLKPRRKAVHTTHPHTMYDAQQKELPNNESTIISPSRELVQ